MNKYILILFIVFCFGNFQSQDGNKINLSRKNISHWEEDKETNWIRVSLISPNKWGFIGKDSIVKIPFEYDFLNPFENGLAYAKIGARSFFITKDNLKHNGDYDEIFVFSYGLAGICKNKKCGFINEKGKLEIPLIYDEIDYFRFSGLCAVKKNNKSGFIDQSGKEIIPIIYEEVYQHKKDRNVLVKNNGKWAIFDNTGKQLSDFKYDDLDSFKMTTITDFSKDIFKRNEYTFFENGAAVVEYNGKYEFINSKAEPAFPNNKFDSATAVDTFHNAIVKRNGKYGIIKSNGELKIPLEYDFIDYFQDNYRFSENYNARKGKVYSILNRDLKKIGESYEPVYNQFSSDNPTLTFKNLKGKYGIVGWQGNTIIPFEYDEIYEVENTPYLIMKKGKYFGVMTDDGKMNIPIKYKSFNSIYDSFEYHEHEKILFLADNKVIDINNHIILSGYESIKSIHYKNKFIVSKNKKFGIVDIHNVHIVPLEYDSIELNRFNPGKLIVSKNKKFGIIDSNNVILLPIEYDKVFNVEDHGPVNRQFIVKNGKTGFVEYETFKVVVPPIYDYFEERIGVVFVSKNNKYGIINSNNYELCPFIYDDIKPRNYSAYNYNSNKIEVFARTGNKYLQIDINGKIIKEISKEYFEKETR